MLQKFSENNNYEFNWCLANRSTGRITHKNELSHLPIKKLSFNQMICEFFSIEKSHSWNSLQSKKLIHSEFVLRIFPSRSVSGSKDDQRQSCSFSLLCQGLIQRCNFLAVWTPIDSFLIGNTGENHDTAYFIVKNSFENFLELVQMNVVHHYLKKYRIPLGLFKIYMFSHPILGPIYLFLMGINFIQINYTYEKQILYKPEYFYCLI